jgi:hypothetical protein
MILSKEGERAEIKPFLLTKIPKTFISIIRLRMKDKHSSELNKNFHRRK